MRKITRIWHPFFIYIDSSELKLVWGLYFSRILFNDRTVTIYILLIFYAAKYNIRTDGYCTTTDNINMVT